MSGLNGQVVSYNGFTFPFLSIGYQGRAEYDGTGRILQGHTITFRGTCYINGTTPTDLDTKLITCLAALNTPRQEFVWTSGGVVIFDIDSTLDRRWGPKPKVVGTPQHVGGLSAKVTFEIETFINFCQGTPGNVEEFWQTESYTLNSSFATTRTVAGQYRVKGGVSAGSSFLTDGSFWPTLPTGFKRTSIQHTLNNDGTILTWSITDQQVHRTLPAPLSEGSATFSLHQRGASLQKTLQGSFEAPLDVDKKIILQFIVALIRARFPGAFTATVTENLTDFRITNHEFENKVDFSVTGMVPGGALANNGTANVGNSLGVTALGWNDVANVGPWAGDGWTASNGTAVQRSMLGTGGLLPGPQPVFNICGQTYTPYNDQYTTSATVPSRNSSQAPTPSGSQGTLERSPYSSQQAAYPYTSWVESIAYLIDRRYLRLPVTSAGTNVAAADIMQRVAYPAVKVLQVGRASRIGANPVYPAPMPVGPAGTQNFVSQEKRETGTPMIMADGQTVEYHANWAYVIECPAVMNFGGNTGVANVAVLQTPPSQLLSSGFNTATGTNIGGVSFPANDGSY